jgi:hypothetical protein
MQYLEIDLHFHVCVLGTCSFVEKNRMTRYVSHDVKTDSTATTIEAHF